MTRDTRKRSRVRSGLYAAGGLAAVSLALVFFNSHRHGTAAVPFAKTEPAPRRVVSGCAGKVELSSQLVNAMGVRTVQVQSAANHERLALTGKLSFDPDRLVRIHSRFAGEVIALGENKAAGGKSRDVRPLRVEDRVTKGQLLAVLSSKDIGEKKSALVDALSSFYVHDAQLKKLAPLEDQVIAGKLVREAERLREADLIQIDRIERTLRSWHATEDEIKDVRAEAEKIHRGESTADLAGKKGPAGDKLVGDRGWAKVEIRAPFDGTILEMNAVEGVMVDTSLDLFKIADLSVLAVMANVYEEDLRPLESLKPSQRLWTIAVNSQPGAQGIVGQFDRISNTVDPTQHTALVRGWLDNRNGNLMAGLAITATVELPATSDEVVVPETALVQDGAQTVVFVAANEAGSELTRRSVVVISRCQNVAYVRSQPTAEDQANGCESLRAGEWVVTAGSEELEDALDSALATTSQHHSVKN